MSTTPLTSELVSSTSGDAQAIVDAATRATQPNALDGDGRFHVITAPAGGDIKVFDLEDLRTKFLEAPRRKAGVYAVHDASSFVTYVLKHGDADSEIWASVPGQVITGVLNANRGPAEQFAPEDTPRWEDHRVIYKVQLTDAWKAWTALDGKLADQTRFAEHIEDRAVDIISPAAADMLELAQTFQATIGVNFESSKRLSSGERQLEYRETVDARAGKAGRMDIPETFVLALVPFEGAEGFKVTARLRYRIDGGNLRIGYKLERPEDVLREAFLSVVAAVQGELTESEFDVPVLRGSAPGTRES